MSAPYQPTLLRRTAAALAAASGFLVIADGQAQSTVTLQGGTGSSCAYSGMTVAPNGNVTVQCTSTNTNAPGTFQFLSSTASGTSSAMLTVTRIGGTQGAHTVTYTPSGAGCASSATGSVSFGDGEGGSKSFTVDLAASGSCTVSLSSSTGGAIGSPASAVITVSGGGGGGGGGGGANCPSGFTAPSNLQNSQFPSQGLHLLLLASSAQVTSVPLPESTSNSATLTAVSSPGTYSPTNGTVEFSISKCPGLIDTDTSNRCNQRFTKLGYMSAVWIEAPTGMFPDQHSTNLRGACWAPRSEGQWYLNVRWTYTECAFGASRCGFNFQWNAASY